MKGIAQIQSGALFGTAFLVTSTRLLTAAHCIDGGEGTTVQIQFRRRLRENFSAISAIVLAKNDEYDAAILELQAPPPPGLEPYELCGCGEFNGQCWTGFGFPAANAGLTNGLKLTGQLIHEDAQLDFEKNEPVRAIQMTCVEAAGWTRLRLNGRIITTDFTEPHILAGISGGPVCATDQGERVVGIIRWAGTQNNQIVFASRIEDIIPLFQKFLPSDALHPWRSETQLFIQAPANASNQLASNIDGYSISSLWEGHGNKTLDCDLSVREAGPLMPVVLRLFAHAPAGVVLRSSNATGWRTRILSLGQDWFPLDDFDGAELASRCHHQVAAPPRTAAARPKDDFCRTIQQACDRWVLLKLDEKWQQLRQNPAAQAETIGYEPSGDNLNHMDETWEAWYPQLEANPELCHHFLSLMLKADGTHNCLASPGIGVGPKTLARCVWPALVFSLLLSPHFVHAFSPTQSVAGNLSAAPPGAGRRSGHVCGILQHKKKILSLGLAGHRWASQVVMLPGSHSSVADMESFSARLDQQTGAIATGLNKPPPDGAVFPAEPALLQAAQTSLADVRAYIAKREVELAEKQRKYANDSGAR